ncbi:MAG: DUF4358 domain-containing protein [Clostridia bacterium]|nr:DUF4358 domain-containing protein [Clostridia bacterium]
MNNKLSGSDFREEELFRRFLEKEKNHTDTSIFDADFENEVSSIEKNPEFNEADADTKKKNRELLSDLILRFPKNKESYKGILGKIRYTFHFITDEDNIRRISASFISVFLIVVFILNIITPSKDISEMENRALSQFPKFSFSALADGSFGTGFEDFISDQFIGRNHFVGAKLKAETIIGKKENHGILIGKDGYLIENSADLTRKNLKSNLKAIEDLASVGRYDITLSVVPTAYEIMKDKLPANSYSNVYGEIYSKIKKHIKSKNIKVADASEILKANKDKELYYRTDHHQTAHGSYWLYTALASALGYEAFGIDRFAVEKVADDFFGTTWSNSGFAKTKADSLYKYNADTNYQTFVSFPTENTSMDTLYNEKMLEKKDKYSYYLDGNHGITEIKSTCPSGRRIAIIKDSYAHSLVPFLTNHFTRIYMIDLRYYSGDIFEYLYNSNVKDVLVLYNQNTFMTDNNLSKISTFAKSSAYNSVPDINYGVVPELPKVDNSYFDDAVFVGDSLTMGISYFAGFNSEFLSIAGLSTKSLASEPLANGKTVYQTIAEMERLNKLYIMLGTNEMAYEKPWEFVDRYSKFIDYVRHYFPNVLIYIQSIMPVSEKRSTNSGIKNYMVIDHNKYLVNLAAQKQCYYIDVNSHFAGEDGFLPEEAGGDGIHLSPTNYRKMADYLKSHAVDIVGVKKIGTEKASPFKGGKYNAGLIGGEILSKPFFKDNLSRVSDALIISTYNIDASYVRSAALFMSGGSTAEEVAVFEVDSAKNAERIKKLIKKRIENKKKDFENYLPGEMPKLNNPLIVQKGNVVVLVISDKADKETILTCIKQGM